MSDKFNIDGFSVETVYAKDEVNYLVFNPAYFCRLVPFEDGFTISADDKRSSKRIPKKIVQKISDYILSRNA